MRYIGALCSSHITVAIMAVLWAGCKNTDDYPLPNATPHDSASASDTTEESKENIAELSRTDPNNEKKDSQKGSIAKNSNTSLDISSVDGQSVTNEATEPRYQDGPLIDQEETEGEAGQPFQLEALIQEVKEEIQLFRAGQYLN
jgi:hypothetical protein